MKRIGAWLTGLLVCATALGCRSDQRSPAERVRDGMSATRDAVREVVADAARRERLLGKVDELEALLLAQSAELDEGARRLRALNADPAAERAAFEARLAQHKSSRRERRARALDVHFAMIELTSAEEWDRIVRRELEALQPMLRLSEEEG